MKLDFPTTNNEAEYEALIAGLGLAGTLRVKNLKVCGDSKLVVSQVKGEFEARDETMAKYEIPQILVTENGTQFNNEEFRKYCEENKIDLRFTSVAHPQANGQAEVANHIILDGLKKRIEKSRNSWVDKVLPILWAYRTTCRVTTGTTPFMLAYGAEAVIPVEISHSSPRIQAYNAEENVEGKRLALDLIDEVRDATHAKIVQYQKKASFYYNLRVKERFFKQGDLRIGMP
ncbi:uncharacterized protein LOC141691909 [Apium graveolens]|uniref:uncharacterized protein LOC141691909 n=1 Tax=Apium graveolens TaxID=4045 RepID=UPI003D7A8F5E